MKLYVKSIGFILTAIVCLLYSNPAFTTEVKVFFSPNGGCLDAVIYEIDNAKRNIDVAMYAFTSRPIAQALIRAHRRGVKLRIILDRKFALESKFSKHKFLMKRGINVKLVSPPPQKGKTGLMHHKFAVIDGKVVLTGSFNWTASAEYLNYENLLIFYSQEMAHIFEKEFNRLWQ